MPNTPGVTLMTVTSVEGRWDIVRGWKAGQSLTQLAATTGVSKKACQHWITTYQQTNDVKERRRSGRRRVLGAAAQNAALAMLIGNEVGSARGIAKQLKSKGLTPTTVSKQTIIRCARDAAKKQGLGRLRALRGKPKKQLSAATLSKRLAFCKEHQNRSWGSVMFTDRKKFAFNYPGCKVHPVTWVVGGGERRAYQVNHASVVNVYAGLTRFGLTKLHVVAGTTGHKTNHSNKKGGAARNITTSEYEEVLKQTLLPEGRRLFGNNGISSWVLQQDNDPTHKQAPQVVKAYNQVHGCSIKVLSNWPPSSPDLSLIENIWAILQARLDAKGCKTFQEFKEALISEAKAIDGKVAQRLFDGMKDRVRECLQKEGNLTKH